MMTQHLRTEKDCLNCRGHVEDRYCTHCGQENIEVKESVKHLTSHFFADLTHYDSKLLTTLKDLILKPGFLTHEYLTGRRTRYLHPVRMYVFVSFLYFFVSLSFNHVEERENKAIVTIASKTARKQIIDSLKTALLLNKRNPKDSVIESVLASIAADSLPDKDLFIIFNISSRDLVVFDSLQHLLPYNKRATGLKPWLYNHWLKTYRLYGQKGSVLLVRNRTEHLIPKLMFFLLPIFAWLLYVFHDRRKYFFVDHLIFSLHFHTAVFMIFLIFYVTNLVFPSLTKNFNGVEYILALVYLGIALNNTYKQSVWVMIAKEIVLIIGYIFFVILGYLLLVTSALL
jgi:hypothetical protein